MAIFYKLKKTYKYVLHENASVEIKLTLNSLAVGESIKNDFISVKKREGGKALVTIKKGYAWDGPSGAVDTKSWMTGSLVHDALYQLMRDGLLSRKLRKEADKAMETINVEIGGMSRFRAWYSRVGVNLFGETFVQSDVLRAP